MFKKILFTACASLFFFYGVDKFGAFDYDEAIYCETVREMVETGDFIVPRFNYEKFYEKPAMFYWLTAVVYKIFSPKDISTAGRIVSSCAAVGTSFLIYYFTTFFAGRRAAVISAVVFATSLGGIVAAKSIVTDGVFVFFLTLSIFSAARSFFSENKKFILLAYISAAIASLTKGPAGAVIPFLICAIFVFAERKYFKLTEIRPFAGISLFLVVALPWFAAVIAKTGGEFFQDFFLVHNIQRFGGKSFEGHGGSLLYYVPVIFFGLFPWSGFLPSIFGKQVPENKAGINKLLLLWTIVPFVLFSVAKTKLPSYILPIFPPLAVIIGAYLDGIIDKTGWDYTSKIAFIIVILTAAPLILLFGGFDIIVNILRPKLIHTQPFLHSAVDTGFAAKFMAAILMGVIICFYFCFRYGKIRTYIIATATMMFFFNFALVGFFMPKIWRTIQGGLYDLSTTAVKMADKNAEIVAYDMPLNPSVVLHAKRKVTFVGRGEVGDLFKLHKAKKNILVITKTGVFKEDLAKEFKILVDRGGYVLAK